MYCSDGNWNGFCVENAHSFIRLPLFKASTPFIICVGGEREGVEASGSGQVYSRGEREGALVLLAAYVIWICLIDAIHACFSAPFPQRIQSSTPHSLAFTTLSTHTGANPSVLPTHREGRSTQAVGDRSWHVQTAGCIACTVDGGVGERRCVAFLSGRAFLRVLRVSVVLLWLSSACRAFDSGTKH